MARGDITEVSFVIIKRSNNLLCNEPGSRPQSKRRPRFSHLVVVTREPECAHLIGGLPS